MRLRAPLDEMTVTWPFGATSDDPRLVGVVHRGVDLRAVVGTPVYAAALGAGVAGDVVLLPACEVAGDHVVPAGVILVGRGRGSVLTGQVTLGAGSILRNLAIIRVPEAPPLSAYAQQVLATGPEGMWLLNETDGLVAYDSSGNGHHGTHANLVLAQEPFDDGNAPEYNGTNSVTDVLAASLPAAFSGTEGTIALWAKVSSAGVWSDGAYRYLARWYVDADNHLWITKGSGSNNLGYGYVANGSTSSYSGAWGGSTDWFHVAFTWDASENEVHLYVDGVEVDSWTAPAGWSGNLTLATFGSWDATGDDVWDGYLSCAAMWTRALSAGEVAGLAVGP